MRSWLRRLAGFSLVPLSLLPLGVIAPVVAPSVAKRIDVLQGVGLTPQAAETAPPPLRNPLAVAPLAVPGQDRRHAPAARGAHQTAKGAR